MLGGPAQGKDLRVRGGIAAQLALIACGADHLAGLDDDCTDRDVAVLGGVLGAADCLLHPCGVGDRGGVIH